MINVVLHLMIKNRGNQTKEKRQNIFLMLHKWKKPEQIADTFSGRYVVAIKLQPNQRYIKYAVITMLIHATSTTAHQYTSLLITSGD